MPAHQRLGLEDDRGSEQGGEQPIEPDENQPIRIPQPEPRRRGSLQDEQLLTEKYHLSFPRRTRSEQSDERAASEPPSSFKKSIIPARLTHSRVCARSDEIFGSHNHRTEPIQPT
jgi:hypothetical protein